VRNVLIFLSLLVLVVIGAACEKEPVKTVNLADRKPMPTPSNTPGPRPVILSIGSIVTPDRGYIYYQQLIDYLAEQIGQPITVVDPGSYEKLLSLLETEKVDVAFVCSGTYVEGRQRFGLELLAAPVVKGKSLYYANVIVPKESSARQLSDLRGQSMAFVDPQSRTGALVVIKELETLGTTPEKFFASIRYTRAHDKSIHAVAFGMADGASVNSFIWDYLLDQDPSLADKARILTRYGPYGIPPVVAAPHTPPELRQQVRQALLSLHLSPRGREILMGLHIDRFAMTEDSAYDSVRQFKWERQK